MTENPKWSRYAPKTKREPGRWRADQDKPPKPKTPREQRREALSPFKLIEAPDAGLLRMINRARRRYDVEETPRDELADDWSM